MIRVRALLLAALVGVATVGAPAAAVSAVPVPAARIKPVVDATILPLMKKDSIAGMAVGIVDGRTRAVFNYGLASREEKAPVTGATLFEVGSISKTFTATLTMLAQGEGRLALSDPASKYLPSLSGTPFGAVRLIALGTHTPGGLPLQVPDTIHNEDQLLAWLAAWRPLYPQGTMRTYANPGIGTLGLIAGKSMGAPFDALMAQRLLPALGLANTFIHVPAAWTADYAQGYTANETPIRMTEGVLWAEAYGIRATASDMLRYLAINMRMIPLDEKLARAVRATHTAYYRAGVMTQDLMWEEYPYPVALRTLLAGNATSMLLDPNPVTAIVPPEAPRDDVWINKTGSTNGFGAYVAFVPGRQLGIVLLANKNYPISERVTAAYAILSALTAN